MPDQLVTIARFRDLPDALLQLGKLESAGIQAELLDANIIRNDWFYSNAVGGIRLQVPQEDAEAASEILNAPIDKTFSVETDSGQETFEQPRCPQCESLNIEHYDANRATRFALLIINLPVSPRGAGQWHCFDCDTRWEVLPESESEAESQTVEAGEKRLVIYVATTNKGKLREFSEIARENDVTVLPANQDREMPEVDEDGDTFEANAAKKAMEYSRYLPGQLIIADDSGLEVTALSGAPGVYSARYAARGDTHKPTDADNNYKLLAELENLQTDDRTARFVCVISAARDGQLLASFRGEARGEILISPLGKRGFGYDPLFYVKEANKTFAEMNSDEKSKYSHRGASFRKFLEWALATNGGNNPGTAHPSTS